MITASDLGWTQQQVDDFAAEYGDPTFQFLLEPYSMDVSTTSDPGKGTVPVNNTLDAILCDDTIVRAWNGTDQVIVGRLLNEDGGGQDWGQITLTATNLDEDVPPSLGVSGTTVRVFWYDGSEIKYHESSNEGGSWGSATTALAVANVIYLAAVSTTKVHYATLTAKNNTRLGFIEYNGSWSATNSYIWWPFEPTSFDAVSWSNYDDGAASSNDIIAMTCDFPPLAKIRVDGTEIVRVLERVQGIALFRYQNGLWSHHRWFDIIDNIPDSHIPARHNVRLHTFTDNEPWIFMTYTRVEGSEDYPHKSLAITRSRTGLHWEMPYLLTALSVGTCSVFIVNGDYCYLIDSTGRKARSPVVGYTDSSNVIQHDLSDNVLSIDITSGDAKNVQTTLANPNGELDDTIDATRMWRMICKMGWYVDGVNTKVTVATAFLDNVSQSRIIPTDHLVLSGRDALGLMITSRADEVQEWDSTQLAGDNFQSMDDTAYSGLRNTAVFTGSWTASNNELILKESDNAGVAFNIKTSYVWNGGARAAIKVAATDTDDYAGVIFRAIDHENFWYVIYNADNDRLVLAERKDNEDTPYIQKAPMGWSIDTWYYIDVEYSYNLISVYAGTSPAALNLQFQHEVAGVPDGTAFTFANIPLMEGSQGYFGHGYSDDPPQYPVPPIPPIEPPEAPEIENWPARVYDACVYGGVYYTSTFKGTDSSDQPTWTRLNTTGAWPSNGRLLSFGIDQSVPATIVPWALTNDTSSFDIIYYNGSTWVDSYSQAQLKTDWSADASWRDLMVDAITGYVYAIARSGPTESTLYRIYKNTGAGWSALYTTGSFFRRGEPGFWVHNNHFLMVFMADPVGWDAYAWYSTDGSSVTYAGSLTGDDNIKKMVFLNSTDPTVAFITLGSSNYMSRYPFGGSLILVLDEGTPISCWDYRYNSDRFQVNASDADVMRFVENHAGASIASRLYTTTDKFSTHTNRGNLDIGLSGVPAPRDVSHVATFVNDDDYDMIIYGAGSAIASNPHTIFVAYGDTDLAPDGKAGDSPGNLATTDSIPYNCEGPCSRGIQVVLGS
jgi:hypothetical protein